MKILFTCGGTAGHVNPAIALAKIFEKKHPGCEVLFVGADGGMENKLVPKEGYQIRSVTKTVVRRFGRIVRLELDLSANTDHNFR